MRWWEAIGQLGSTMAGDTQCHRLTSMPGLELASEFKGDERSQAMAEESKRFGQVRQQGACNRCDKRS
jgi:hypothetical protein